ncbi:hypothetical protein MRQ36_08540 [Micromonospora sp. R77]|uniref:hypothetical protein n=1 Tax=Micromonospora sp. R77 TaxID=2925836 RepID=UPI001F61CD4A|nr:hypothetical protein [Micromonospora sp. R77]MCI4062610.1 hypothetical protein [Micromonospora sp. R77]
MDERIRVRPGWWDRPEPVEALAAFAVGVLVAARGLALLVQSGYADLVEGSPVRAAPLVTVLLTVVVAAVALVPRLPGWPVVAGALLLVAAADQVAGGPVALVSGYALPARTVVPAVLAAVGVGVALGGTLLAVGQAPRAARWLPAGGLAAGLVLQPVATLLVQDTLPDRYARSVSPVTVQLWLAVLVTVLAALLANRRGLDVPVPPVGRPAVRPVLVVVVAAALTVAGLLVRSWVVTTFRVSPDGFAGYRRTRAVEEFGHWSLVLVAALVGLVLLWWAYRAGGVPAARWVALCVGAGPALLYAFRIVYRYTPQSVFLVTVTGVAALTAAALLARSPARTLPWDAVGLVLAAVAMPLGSAVVRAQLPSTVQAQPVLMVVGLGLALGFGLSAAARTVGRPVEETGVLTGLLVLGPAALVLAALALAPVVVRAQADGPYREPLLTVPVFVTGTAVALVLIFAFTRAVERLRRDLRAEATLTPPTD